LQSKEEIENITALERLWQSETKIRFMPEFRMLMPWLHRECRSTGLSEPGFSGVMKKTMILAPLRSYDWFPDVKSLLRIEKN
jgi:hypothetical protein